MCLYKGIDYKGKTIGCYEVLDDAGLKKFPSGQTTRYWKVKCIHCGNEKEIGYQKVLQSLQDGCSKCVKNRFAGANSFNWKGTCDNVPSMYYHKLMKCAKKRGLDFELSRNDLDDLFKKQNGKCRYTNYDLHFGQNRIRGTASLDRIDSSKGYTKENVQWVHKDINQIKWDLSHARFLELCKTITENNKNERH